VTHPSTWTRYAALGDSFTEGLTDDLGPDGRHRGWADLVALALAEQARSRGAEGIQYANLAVRGRLTSQVIDEQVPAVVALQPDLVSLAVGVNDALRRRFDVDSTATHLENGVRALRATGSDVLVFAFGDPSRRSRTMGVIRDRIRAYNSAVDAIASHYGCFQVHFWDVAAMDDDRLWAEDRLHLSSVGHQLAAACALEALGVGDPEWRTPLVPEPRPRRRARVLADARWAGGHVIPWLARRARGTSSGDGIAPKHPGWILVTEGPWVAAPKGAQ
jgi:lysophospholipase L1-like esterase